MCKKVFYFGLGLADFILEIFNQMVEKGEMRLQTAAADSTNINDGSLVFVSSGTTHVEMDDLTEIKGIGPTFASRLEDAGITSYQSLADLTPDELKEITHVADWQGDPGDWINQAKAYENSH